MTAFPTRRRNRTLSAALAGVLVLVAAPLLGLAGWNVLKNSKSGTEVEATEEIAFPSTPTAMLAVVDEQNLVVSLAVLVMSPRDASETSASGGTIVSLPTNANRASGEEPVAPIADSLINFGEQGLIEDAGSLARVTIGTPAIVDEAALTLLLTPVGDIAVTLPNDVITAAADGSTDTLFVAGEHQLSPAETASVLAARDPSQNESRRLPNVHAVWDGIAAAVGPGLPVEPTDADGIETSNDFLSLFLSGPVQVSNEIGSRRLSGTANPEGLDVGTVDVASVLLLMGSLAPSAVIQPNERLSFRIENGLTQADVDAAGLEGMIPSDITIDLIRRLLFLQGNVVSVAPTVATLEPKEAPDITVVFSPDELPAVDLETITRHIGEVEFKTPPFKYPLVNVVIVVGRSYLADIAEIRASQSSAADTDATESTDASESTDETAPTDVGDTATSASDTVTSE